ncbi:MAG: Flagellar basal body P-ring biosynthesis protein-like protein [Pedosphaera sp.]|nr:Flagellar basal body P-ring biosynthesis protein-like protein [Pedosphaera sp.]
MKNLKSISSWLLAGMVLVGVGRTARAEETVAWKLSPQAEVDSAGIFLDQIVPTPASTVALPHLRLAPAPSPGQTASLSRNQICELVQKQTSGFVTTNWSGATQVRVSRRTRQFDLSEITSLLTATLQRDFVKSHGELELRLTRPWTPVAVPDEPLTLKVGDLPSTGLCPNFVVSCELWNGRERVGEWQLAVQAAVWHDVPLARSTLQRGELLKDADISMERRDLLSMRDIFPNYPTSDSSLELAENVPAGTPLYNHAVRPRPILRRGHLVEAVFQEGSLSISLKVETLEDGLLGQTVRVRNPKTKRELYGKVQNEDTVLINL